MDQGITVSLKKIIGKIHLNNQWWNNNATDGEIDIIPNESWTNFNICNAVKNIGSVWSKTKYWINMNPL